MDLKQQLSLLYYCLEGISVAQWEFKAFLWMDHKTLTLTEVLLMSKIFFKSTEDRSMQQKICSLEDCMLTRA